MEDLNVTGEPEVDFRLPITTSFPGFPIYCDKTRNTGQKKMFHSRSGRVHLVWEGLVTDKVRWIEYQIIRL